MIRHLSLMCLLVSPWAAHAQSPWPPGPAVVEPDGEIGDAGAAVTPPFDEARGLPPKPEPIPSLALGVGMRIASIAAALAGAYLLGLILFAAMLPRGWSPAGALLFSLFIAGLIATTALAWFFNPGHFIDGHRIPWWQHALAWRWGAAPWVLLTILGLAVWFGRPRNTRHQGV
jgi:hypothetical protein